jgi:hypothetical protein
MRRSTNLTLTVARTFGEFSPRNLTNLIFVNVISKIISKSPPECESVSYDTFTSTSVYPNPGSAYARLKNNPTVINHFASANISYKELTFERIQSSTASVIIYFEDIRFTRISEKPSRLVCSLSFKFPIQIK